MKKHLIALITILSIALAPLSAGCGWWSKNVQPDIHAAYDCAKEEAKAASGGHMASIVIDILSQFAEAVVTKNVTPTLENLFAVYGEPIVACTLKEIATPPAPGVGSGTTAPSTADAAGDPFVDAARQVMAQRGWHFTK